MPVTVKALKALCNREKNSEEQKWKDICISSLINASEDGYLLECKIQDKNTLQPLSYEHRFRENQKVKVLTDKVDMFSQYSNVMKYCKDNWITGIEDNGNIILRSSVTLADTVFVLDAGPLLDDYDRQRDIIECWLENTEQTVQAQRFLSMLNSSPLETISKRNEKSAKEIYNASQNGDDLLLVQGPPGCGKTWLCAEIIKYALQDNLSIGVFAFTNRACDQLLKTFAEKHSELVNKLYRFGNDEARKRNLDHLGIHRGNLDQHEATAVGSTLYQLTKWVNENMRPDGTMPQYDLVIVDEASQATLPMISAPLACAKKIILVGDQKQLPPVLKTKAGEDSELYQSAFEYLSDRQPYVFLDKTYRMRPAVCTVPSKAFYDENLEAHNEAESESWQNIPNEPLLNSKPGQQLIIIKNHSPEAEAEVIRSIIDMWEKHLGAEFEKKQMNDPLRYLISCFYRKQVNLVRQKLNGLDISHNKWRYHIDTVERNQGQTCVIGFLSIAGNGNANRGVEWSMDPRRLNVAITRARAKNYILAPPDFIESACSNENPSDESRTAWKLLKEQSYNLI